MLAFVQGWLATAISLERLVVAFGREWRAVALALARLMVAIAVERVVVVLSEEWVVVALAAVATCGTVIQSPIPTTTSRNPRTAVQSPHGRHI